MDSSQVYDDVEMLTKAGSVEVTKCNITKAVSKYQEAYEIAQRLGSGEVYVSCACNLGAALLSQGDPDSAIQHLDQALKRLEEEEPPKTETLRGDILFNLGLAHAMRKDLQSAIQYFCNAIHVFRECSDLKGFADSCQQCGEQHVKLSQLLKAAKYFREAAEGYHNSGRAFLAAKMVVRQGQCLHDSAKSEESLSVLHDLEKFYSQIENSTTDSGKLAKLFCDAGCLLFQLRSPKSACVWLHRALDVMRSTKHSERSNEKLEARILLALGEACSALCDFTKAVMINKEASALYGKLENKKARGKSFYQLAEAYRHLGDHHSAEKYYHIAYQTLEDAGLHGFLWQVLEGLADLNYQRRQLDTSISYYKETVTQLSHSDAHPSIQRHIVSKLATALEVQRVGVVKAEAYKKRVPVLVEPEKDLGQPVSHKNSSPDIPVIQSPIYAPLTSTRLSLYSSMDHSVDKRTRLDVPGRKKKRKSKRHGRRRSGSFDRPVTKGVGEYDTETDISLVGRSKKGKKSYYSKLSRLESEEVKSTGQNKVAPRRLLSHIKGLEIDEDGAAPTVSSVDDSTQMEVSPVTKHPIHKGLNTDSFSESDTAPNRGRSASQTVITDDDSSSSTSNEDDDIEDDSDEDDSLTQVSSDEDGSEYSSQDDSEEDTNNFEEELKHLSESPRPGLGNTYEYPSTSEPMYATIKSRKLSSGQAKDRLYESLDSTASTALLTSTIPKRSAPSLPSPPEPPRGPRPSQRGDSQSKDEKKPARASWDGATYPESSVLSILPRGQREIGLYQVARLEQERRATNSRSSISTTTSEAKVPKSRACIVM
ncbi:uncharacterized protein LOC110984726 isoform X3 [Acanthaster planci]|nr:uncharacterized protein LOC110984726 isoform X3 [Acanthaster planci]XP_022100868.1 uncharacterized protein LOC110984726 isoform X3 [Acanthaster planci]